MKEELGITASVGESYNKIFAKLGSDMKKPDICESSKESLGYSKVCIGSLDVTYKEDENRTRKGTAPQNMALLKRIAFNTVKNDTQKHPKESMKGR